MYCINYLFRAGVPASNIVCVYTSIIRFVLEYGMSCLASRFDEKNCQKTLSVYNKSSATAEDGRPYESS